MTIMPEVIPVSQLRDRHKEIFQQVADGPILLAEHSKVAAVLVSVADWNARERQLELLEARLKYLEIKQQFAANSPHLVSFDEIEESVRANT
jgi:prevent-host-death family protein